VGQIHRRDLAATSGLALQREAAERCAESDGDSGRKRTSLEPAAIGQAHRPSRAATSKHARRATVSPAGLAAQRGRAAALPARCGQRCEREIREVLEAEPVRHRWPACGRRDGERGKLAEGLLGGCQQPGCLLGWHPEDHWQVLRPDAVPVGHVEYFPERVWQGPERLHRRPPRLSVSLATRRPRIGCPGTGGAGRAKGGHWSVTRPAAARGSAAEEVPARAAEQPGPQVLAILQERRVHRTSDCRLGGDERIGFPASQRAAVVKEVGSVRVEDRRERATASGGTLPGVWAWPDGRS
jgi:hypothetical protein